MAICEIHHTVLRNERSPFGQGTAVSWCTTHSMQVSDAQRQGLCPLGRIEEATEQALARIQALAIEVLNADKR
jgi:hypothetical protein